jgi:hypothetical protein
MNTLIAEKLYEYALEKYKMIQLLNMSAETAKQQTSEFNRLERAAAQDRQDLDRKGDPEWDDPTLLREFFTTATTAVRQIPAESPYDFFNESMRKNGDVFAALEFEASLDEQLKIDASMNGCMKRAKDLLRDIKTLSYELAQRLDHEWWMGIIERAQDGRDMV